MPCRTVIGRSGPLASEVEVGGIWKLNLALLSSGNSLGREHTSLIDTEIVDTEIVAASVAVKLLLPLL